MSLLYKLIFRVLWPRQRLTRCVARHLNNRVVAGFAEGMIYPPKAVWGNPANKLVGTYEKELMPYWHALDAQPPRVVFDVGAAEGYYAVGSALRWPSCTVYAWEMDGRARQALRSNAGLNVVQDRVHIAGVCGEEALYEAITELAPDLIVMDVEGAERVLCSERCIRMADRATWIVECHEEATVQALQQRFAPMHHLQVVVNQPRTAHDCSIRLPWYCRLLSYDRWRLVYEGRPFSTPWIVATTRQAPKEDVI